MLFMFEYRGTKLLISEQFRDTTVSIVSIHVDSDIMSLDGRQPLETEAEIKEDGKLHVTKFTLCSLQETQLQEVPVSIIQSSRGPTPRPSNFEEEIGNNVNKSRFYHGNAHYPAPNPGMFSPNNGSKPIGANAGKKPNGQQEGGKDLHMFVWSSSASPVSDVFGGHDYGALDQNINAKEVRVPCLLAKEDGPSSLLVVFSNSFFFLVHNVGKIVGFTGRGFSSVGDTLV
ncbi:Auxin efflux carrier component 1 [Forsythia ovata]|uniref:Auxin efflux carrier component 1 n=1 Tax=Forsythia ovata TaxID=205694 RepID=A0ABD1X8M3_9LAMI